MPSMIKLINCNVNDTFRSFGEVTVSVGGGGADDSFLGQAIHVLEDVFNTGQVAIPPVL